MKSRRHRAIKKAQDQMWLREVKELEEVFASNGFTKKEVSNLPSFQNTLLRRMLRGGRGEIAITRNVEKGRAYPKHILGVDFGTEDKTVAISAERKADGTTKVLGVEELM